MQIDIAVNASGRFCRVRVIGRMDASEYRAAAARFLEHPGVSPGIGVVYDLRDAQVSHLTADDFRAMREVNNSVAPRRGRARIAFVVPDEASYGLARMYEVVGASSNLETHVFSNDAEAEQWVQQPAPAPTGED